MSEKGKVYTEKQTAEILQRAARLQEGGSDVSVSGLSHQEVLRAAAELGIAPENVESAMAALERKNSRGAFGLTQQEVRVVNAELDPSEFDVILEVAKPAQMRRQSSGQIGRTLSVRTHYKGGLYRVEVISRNGQTRIQVTSVPIYAFLMSLYPALLIAFIGSGSIGAAGINMTAVLFAFLVVLLGLATFVPLVGKANRSTAGLADEIEAQVREATAKSVSADRLGTAQPEEQSEHLLSQTH